MLDFKTHADNVSLYNTPPYFAILVADLVRQWIKEQEQGGVEGMARSSAAKSQPLYEFLAESDLFKYFSNFKSPYSR